jgi:hypothetical protein
VKAKTFTRTCLNLRNGESLHTYVLLVLAILVLIDVLMGLGQIMA